ncbi:MAG: class I SAM-dependent methyltransferase [Cyanobacteria bacterium P01_F01_bin.42]
MGLNQKFMAWAMAYATSGYEAAMIDRKSMLFAGISGSILEIGPGAGSNLRYLNDQVNWTGVEPNSHMIPYLQKEAESLGQPIDISLSTLDDFEATDAFDYVVSTLVLCSVPDLAESLRKIYAVLKPGGKFLFVEHVAAPEGSLLRQMQTGLRPIWSWIGDGCQLNRQTGSAIRAAGFNDVSYEAFDAPVPIALIRPHICGVAIK